MMNTHFTWLKKVMNKEVLLIYSHQKHFTLIHVERKFSNIEAEHVCIFPALDLLSN